MSPKTLKIGFGGHFYSRVKVMLWFTRYIIDAWNIIESLSIIQLITRETANGREVTMNYEFCARHLVLKRKKDFSRLRQTQNDQLSRWNCKRSNIDKKLDSAGHMSIGLTDVLQSSLNCLKYQSITCIIYVCVSQVQNSKWSKWFSSLLLRIWSCKIPCPLGQVQSRAQFDSIQTCKLKVWPVYRSIDLQF